MRRRVAAIAIAAALLAGAIAALAADAGTRTVAHETPIIAEVLNQPEKFVGHRVAIYGLAIEARNRGQRFLLQDVSQMPLMVVSPPGERVAPGRQVMVYGTVRWANGQLELAGERLLDVKVLVGGGCC